MANALSSGRRSSSLYWHDRLYIVFKWTLERPVPCLPYPATPEPNFTQSLLCNWRLSRTCSTTSRCFTRLASADVPDTVQPRLTPCFSGADLRPDRCCRSLSGSFCSALYAAPSHSVCRIAFMRHVSRPKPVVRLNFGTQGEFFVHPILQCVLSWPLPLFAHSLYAYI